MMFNFIFERVFPGAPNSASSKSIVQHEVIEALTAHLARLGHPVESVLIPPSAMNADICFYTTAAASFWVQPGLDPFGCNVITSALPSGIVTNDNTASATVASDTVTASAEPDVEERAPTKTDALTVAAQLDLRALSILTTDEAVEIVKRAYEANLNVKTIIISREQMRAWVGGGIGCIDTIVTSFGRVNVSLRACPDEVIR